MYAPVASAPKANAAFPLAGILCLGILGLLIASTIVLALIPIYLPAKQLATTTTTTTTTKNSSTTSAGNASFYVEYTSSTLSDGNYTGSVSNLAQIGSQMGVGTTAVTAGQSNTGFARKRRSIVYEREKRSLMALLLFTVTTTYPSTCTTQTCQNSTLTALQQQIQSTGNLSNVTVTILSGNQTVSITTNLIFVSILTTKPSGFGEVSSLSFTAIQNGSSNSPSTWSSGIVPYTECNINIPQGVTVTHAFTTLGIKVDLMNIYGTFAFGVSNQTFTFDYPITIIVQSGGTLQSNTAAGVTFPTNSLIIVQSNGTISSGINSTVAVAGRAAGDHFSISAGRGPSTSGIDINGGIHTYAAVEAIVQYSGDFLSASTYVGNIAPSSSLCSGSCGIDVLSGCTLSTSSLNGTLSLNIASLTVESGAVLDLGTSGLSSGFKFSESIYINVLGSVSYVESGGGILLPSGSTFNLQSTGQFSSSVSTYIQTYDTTSGNSLGNPLVLGTSKGGPYAVTCTSSSCSNSTNTETNTTTTTATTTPLIG